MKHMIAAVMLAALAATTFANDLDTYRATYEKQTQSIVLQHAQRVIALGQNYAAYLKKVTAKVQAQGNLQKTKTAMAEAERFRAEMHMPDTLSSVPEIKEIQLSYQKARDALDSDKAQSIVTLVKRYDQALEKLQRSLVASGQLDDAEAVRKERAAVVENDDVTSAKEFLANAAAAKAGGGEDSGTEASKAIVVGTVGKTIVEAEKINVTTMLWQVSPENVKAGRYKLSCQHVAPGKAGAFYLVVYTDSDLDGLPDRMLGKSQRLSSLSSGKWSSWGFWARSSHKNLFVGVAFDNASQAILYSQADTAPEGYVGLGETAYYARNIGDKPQLKDRNPRYTNIRLQLP